MAEKEGDGGMVGKLAGKGEEALGRLMEELGRNPRVTDALDRAMSAKGKLDDASRSAIGGIGLAAAEEIRELREKVDGLEKRVGDLEKASGKSATARRSATKKTPSAKRSTKTASGSTRKKAEEAASPDAGRSIGGGAARGGAASSGRSPGT